MLLPKRNKVNKQTNKHICHLKNENSQLKNNESMASEDDKLTILITTLSDQSQDQSHSTEVSYASVTTKPSLPHCFPYPKTILKTAPLVVM